MEVCLSSFPSRFPSWVAGPGPANYGVWRWRGDGEPGSGRLCRTDGVDVQKPPPIVEGHNLQPLHPADQQWVGTHQQQSPAQPVQQVVDFGFMCGGRESVCEEVH